jgi:hypothetical protein
MLVPHKVVAATTLYLSEPAGSDPTQAIANDASLAHTRLVAQEAVATSRLPMSATNLLSRYRASVVSDAIMSITLSAPSGDQAEEWDNAVATAFLKVRVAQLRLQARAMVDSLQNQRGPLEATISQLNTSIAALSPSNPQSASQRNDLSGQRDTYASAVSAINTQMQQALAVPESVSGGSRVLDPAAVLPAARKKVIIKDALSGLIAGLGAGLGIVLVGVIISDRPRRRDDVAAILGAPIALSTPRGRRQLRSRRRLLSKRDPYLVMVARRLRSELESASIPALIVAPVDSSTRPALAVVLLATDLASEGKSVLLADAAKGRPLASLFRAKSTDGDAQTVTVGGPAIEVLVFPDDPAEMADTRLSDDVDVVIVLAAPQPALGAEHLAMWAMDAVVTVTAGESTAARIRGVGQLLRQAGITVRSAILFDADPDDDSVGTVGPDEPEHDAEISRLRVVGTTNG